MTATDSMNATQFPIEEVGKMRASDFGDMTMEQVYQMPKASRTMFWSTRNPGNTYKGQHIKNDDVVYTKSGKSLYHPPPAEGPNRMAKQRALTADVAQHGVHTPLEGSHWGPGDDTVTQGHHRYWAARDTGQTHLPMQMVDWT